MDDKVIEDLVKAVNHEEPDQVPVAIYNTAPWATTYLGERADKYYFDPELRLRTQLFFAEEFPGAWLVPGVWPEFTVVEPSLFGCPITWFEDSGPHVHPVMEDIRDVRKMKPMDPMESEIVQQVVKQYYYMRERIDPQQVEDCWYLRGCPLVIGPFELAAQVRGYADIMYDVIDHPQLLHQLLEMTTDAILSSLKVQGDLCGGLKVILLADHNTVNLSPQHCSEFLFSYIETIVDAIPDTIVIYHNEGPANHVLDQIGACGAKIFHCGDIDLQKAKHTIGDKITLMGNLHAWDLMVNGTPEDVKEAAGWCLETAAAGGGFILTTGGGHDPNTPKENIRAMVESVKEWKH